MVMSDGNKAGRKPGDKLTGERLHLDGQFTVMWVGGIDEEFEWYYIKRHANVPQADWAASVFEVLSDTIN